MQPAQVHQGLLAGQGTGWAATMDGHPQGHQRGELRSLRLMVGTRAGVKESAHGGLRGHSRGPEVLGGLYAKRPVYLPAFERPVRAHIPWGVPKRWKSVQDYTVHDLEDAVKQARPDDKSPGSNRVTAALIMELPELRKGSCGTPTKQSSVAQKSQSRGMRPSSG